MYGLHVFVFGIAAERLNLGFTKNSSLGIYCLVRVSPLGHVCFGDSGFRVLNPVINPKTFSRNFPESFFLGVYIKI